MSRRKKSSKAPPSSEAPVTGDTGSAGKVPARPIRRTALLLGIAVLAGVVGFIAWQWAGPTAQNPGSGGGMDSGVASLPAPAHVGGSTCTQCHAKEHEAWKGSDHDLAMQVASEQSMLGNFSDAKFTYAGVTSTFFRRDGKYFVNTDGADGKLADFEIKYAFGVRPLQQYLVEFPGGRMQALSVAWDSRPKAAGGQRWFHLYPGQNIRAGNWLHWTAGGQNWNFTCAECHSTNLRKNFDARTGTFKTTWSELNVSCEACHGPASNHLAWARKDGDWRAFEATRGLAQALDERRGVTWTADAQTGTARRSAPRKTSREIDTCARCHGRAARVSDDFVHGKPPQDTHRLALIEDNLYWPDGQMRDEVYNWGSFLQSRMHAHGVTCSDCHNPHSLKLKAPGNAVCAQCHLPAKFDVEQHTHHAPGSPGAACTACHMPTTTYMVVDPRHDHSLRIPRPDLSVALGVPNACNNCHVKKTAQWATDAIFKWTGKPLSGFQQFANALAAGAGGAPGARGALLTLIDDPGQPAIVRASAIARLGAWMTPTTLPAVTRALNDADATVRLAAVEVLAGVDVPTRQRYLPRMLADPVRLVRLEAAFGLAGPGETGLAPGDRALFDRALAELVLAQDYNADRPEGRSRKAQLQALRGNAEGAIAEYRKAIDIDPTHVAAYANLADLYRTRGADTEAETLLRQGVARVPGSGALQHALGLVLVRQKRSAEALKALSEAARLEPGNPRFAYVYAVALNDAGRRPEGMKVLHAALARHQYDRDILLALAYYSAGAGDQARAMEFARQLRDLDPENAEYAKLARQFEGGVPR